MKCPNCGYVFEDNGGFCPSCGLPVEKVGGEGDFAPRERERDAYDLEEGRDPYDDYDVEDPIEKLKTRSKSAYDSVSRNVSRRVGYAVKGWQQACVGLAAGSALFMLVALFAFSGSALMGLAACALMVLWVLKKPKFDALEMALPLMAFAGMYATVGIRAALGGGLLSMLNLENLLGLALDFSLGGYSGLEVFGGGTADLIIRLVVYAMAVSYALMLFGVIRRLDAVCYALLGGCGVVGLYNLVDFFRYISRGLGPAVFHLGSLLFVAAFALFTLRCKKPRRIKGVRSNPNALWLRELLAVNPSPYSDYDFSEYHPYYTLGGWLQVVVVALYIRAILWPVSGLVGLIGMVLGQILSLPSPGQIFSLVLLVPALLALNILAAFMLFRLAAKIRARDCSFLPLYHVSVIVMEGTSFLLELGTGNALGAVFSLALSLGLAALVTLYFAKSVRVRSYMLTDEYLARSVLTRRVTPPQSVE